VLTFLSPLSVLIAVGCVVPLFVLSRVRGKGRRTRASIGLPEPPSRWYVVPFAAIVLAAGLVGLAAAQPVVEFEETRRVRTDAEVFIVLDTSRSMLAKERPGQPSRIARSKAAAQALRDALSAVPVGLASITDRALPHLFPSGDEEAFRVTLARSIGIENPPPIGTFLARVTRLEAIAAFATRGFFSPTARKRLLVVLTDGETLPWRERLDVLLRRPPGIRTVFVRFGNTDERVFAGRLPEPGYRPDPGAHETLERFASSAGGTAFTESELPTVTRSVREIVGDGPTVVRGERSEHVALAPYLAGAAFFPLVLLLWRRDR
jgi:hypothetical protein